MRFAVLGPLRVTRNGVEVTPRAAMLRRLLAMVLAHPDEPVPVSDLVDGLWPSDPPDTASKTIQVYVSRLRSELGDPNRLTRIGGGYALRLGTGELDAREFVDAVRAGQRLHAAGDPATADDHLERALTLWRGPPFADAGDAEPVRPEVQRLTEWRVRALEERAAVGLTRGRHAELIPELAGLVAEFPYRERLSGQLMLALYRSGRQADALAAFRQTRGILREELGVEPGPTLRNLHQAILECDSALGVDPPVGATPAGRDKSGATVDLTDLTGPAAAAESASPESPAPPTPVAIAESDDEPTADPVIPAQLPPDLVSLFGRESELAGLVAARRQRVCVITGMAGIGKSALAVHVAHRLAPDFPDGQVFLDLHGFSRGLPPVEPAQALERLLRLTGLPGDRVPHDIDERAALWRSRSAGKRLLILLDNAGSESQVRPLLPGTPGSLVLVTSRRALGGLDDAYAVSLDVLPENGARELFEHVVGSIRADDSEPEAWERDAAVRRIVELCGRLPLAVRLLASRFAGRPAWTLDDLEDRLYGEHGRLGEMEVGERSVAGAFGLSYDHLLVEQQRLFRLLALHPGGELDAYAAAALADIGLHKAERMLEELLELHLVQSRVYGRYTFHDLLRVHAAETVAATEPEDGRRAALNRLLTYYTHSTASAMDAYVPSERYRRPTVPEPNTSHRAFDPSDPATALCWLDTERANLVAVTARAADLATADAAAGAGATGPLEPAAVAVAISTCLHRYLLAGSHLADAVSLHGHAVRAARAVADRRGEGRATDHLGAAYLRSGRPTDARTAFSRSLECALATGDELYQRVVYANLGTTLRLLGELPTALTCATRAVDLNRAAGDQVDQARALCTQGAALVQLGRAEEAERAGLRALELARRAGSPLVEPHALMLLGEARFALGRYAEAHLDYTAATDLHRETGFRPGVVGALVYAADALRELGRHDDALDRLAEASALSEHGGDPAGDYEVQRGLAAALTASGNPEAALDHLRRALEVGTGLDLPDAERARTAVVAGRVHAALDDPATAADHWRTAHDIYRRLGMPAAEQVERLLASA